MFFKLQLITAILLSDFTRLVESNDTPSVSHTHLRGSDTSTNIFTSEHDVFVDKVSALRDLFVAWKKNHNKIYSSFNEELQRMLIWIENHGM